MSKIKDELNIILNHLIKHDVKNDNNTKGCFLMERFIMDGTNQRVIRIREDALGVENFSEDYVKYAIPYSDLDALIAALKVNGNIKPEVQEVTKTVDSSTLKTIYDSPDKQLHDIVNTQASIIDKQLNIIQTFLVK